MILNPIGEIITSLKPSKLGVAVATVDAEDLLEMIELYIREHSARLLNLEKPAQRPTPQVNIR